MNVINGRQMHHAAVQVGSVVGLVGAQVAAKFGPGPWWCADNGATLKPVPPGMVFKTFL